MKPLSVRRISIPTAPAPGGSYSQAVAANGFLYTAGMGPIDPATGDIVGEDVGNQTRQVMQNLHQLLKAEGLGFADVVFSNGLPVRTTVGSTLLNILVEIDLIVAYPGGASA